ncbi:MAG: HPr(Ser) kinase/phosphatase [Defluviitaleaceae bacterium]|nr:HPr(Ser) kinase/phosphatase [Defluviitaleaceae bacterium]
MKSIPIAQLVEEFHLNNYIPEMDYSDMSLSLADINRPALQLTGFFKEFEPHRLQVIGVVEHTYLSELPETVRKERIKAVFDTGIPCLVICRGLEPFPEMLTYAVINKIPIFGCQTPTTEFIGEVIKWLKVQLAPQINMHGVLVDIYGEGVLITGDSGIGKSEAALELVKRGHRLVADDAVEVKKVSAQTLIGTAPEVIRYFIELRGVGIIDVRQMFGVEAVKTIHNIDLVINLEIWDDKSEYERLGLEESYTEILGNKVVSHSIPIRPGRNIAIICEAAAVNHRQKKMGYNSAKILNERIQNMHKR